MATSPVTDPSFCFGRNPLGLLTLRIWRKRSSRSIEQLLVDFTNLVNRGVVSIINLRVSKASFIAVVAREMGAEKEIEKGRFGGGRDEIEKG